MEHTYNGPGSAEANSTHRCGDHDGSRDDGGSSGSCADGQSC
jgi:hypothetical protein